MCTGREVGDSGRPTFWLREAGQSLVEFAILVPLLLIVFLGAADVGRLFFYTSMISNAAREGAIYAANHSAALPNCSSGCAPLSSGPVLQHVCDASGAADHGAPCPAELKVASAIYGPGHDAAIAVTYDFSFIVTSLASRLIPSNPVTLRASSTFLYRQ
jgi:TadE-like protein